MPVVTRYSDGPPIIAYSLRDAAGRPLAERNADAVFYAASTIKLAVLLAVMRAADAGTIDLEDTLECPPQFASAARAPDFVVAPEDADPDYPADGTQLSVSRMLRMMVSHSSNEATNVLVDRIGLPAVAEALRRCGASVSKLERLIGDVEAADAGLTNEVSAGDLTTIMRCVVAGELTTPHSTEFMRTLLTSQEQVRIGNAVATGMLWGSKSGDVPGIEHDVAFVGDPNGPNVRYLAVCTRGYEPGQGRELIASTASALLTGRGAHAPQKRFVREHDSLQRIDDPARVGFSLVRLDAIDRYVKAQAENGGPSLAISVVKDGAIVKESAYGYAKKYDTHTVDGAVQPARLLPQDEWEPATVDTLYDLASNTKMYATNYAIQHLVSEGILDLDRTLHSFPGWENYTDAATRYTGDWVVGGRGGIDQAYTGKSTITVADLLHHTAGELPDPQYPNAQVAGGLYYQSADIRDRSGIIDVICRTPLIAGPHTEFRYSDVDYMILGLLVEQLTGQRLDTYLQEQFYGPLGLHRTTFNPLLHGFTKQQTAATELNGNTRDGHVSFGNLPDGTPAPIRHNTLQGEVHDEKGYYSMGGVSGHAGLFSTVGDLAVLTQLMLNGGVYGGRQYFTREVAEQFTAPYALDPADVDSSTIGLGWRLQSATGDGYHYFNEGPSRSSYGHAGWTGTLTVIDPAYDMTITIVTNLRHSPVVDPPNGFAGSRFPIAELTPVVARVYAALLRDDE